MTSIILYDGVCNLCDHTVKFILKRDKKGVFNFAPLQSSFAKEELSKLGYHLLTDLSSVVLVSGGKVFSKSSAFLEIIKKLPLPWPLFFPAIIIPKVVRDLIYDWISKNRYRWFGKSDTCLLPKPEWKSRFVAMH